MRGIFNSGIAGLLLLMAGRAPAAEGPSGRPMTVAWHFRSPLAQSGSVLSFAQIPGGPMVIGETRGVRSWNGFENTFQSEGVLGVPSRPSFALTVDDAGMVWVGLSGSAAACDDVVPCSAENTTTTGITRIARATDGPPPAATVDGRALESWALLADGSVLWSGGPGGLFQRRAGTWRSISLRAEKETPFVTALAKQGDALLIGTTRGARVLRNGVEAALPVPGLILGIAVAGDATWFATRDGLYRQRAASPSTPARFGTANGLPSDDVRAVAVSRDGTVWAGTRMGLAAGFDQGFAPVDDATLAQARIQALAVDDEDGLWIGTRTEGVWRASRSPARTFGRRDGLPFEEAVAVASDARGVVWAAGKEGLLVRIDGGAVVPMPATQPAAARGLRAMAVLPTGDLIFSARNAGMFTVGATPPHRTNPLRNLTSVVLAFHHAADGSLWTGEADGTVVQHGLAGEGSGGYQTTERRRFRPSDGLCPGDIRDLTEAADHAIWIAHADGSLGHIADGRARCIAASTDGNARPFSSIVARADGGLWMGATGGIVRYQNGAFVAAGEANADLRCDDITRIAFDDTGHVWTACRGSISRLDLHRLEHWMNAPVAEQPTTRIAPLHFVRNLALRSAESSVQASPSATLTPDGRFWVATLDGLAIIEPPERTPYPPGPRVQGATLFAGTTPVARVAPGVRSAPIEVEFGVPLWVRHDVTMFAFAEQATFEFHISSRTDAGSARHNGPQGALPALHRGDHVITLRAANAFGIWSDQAITLPLRVVRPWRERPTTWLAGAVLLLAIGVAIRQSARRRARALQTAVQEERERLARDLHDSLGQGVASLGLHLETASIQAEAAQPVAQAIRDTQGILRQFEHETRQMIWHLRAREAGNVSLRKGLERLAAGRGTPCRLNLSDALETGDAMIDFELLQIAREAVTNANKHAQARTIVIDARTVRGSIKLRISDDGKGFDAEAAPGAANGHFGILGMKERVRRMAGSLAIESAPGLGTIIEIHVPVHTPQPPPSAAAPSPRPSPAEPGEGERD